MSRSLLTAGGPFLGSALTFIAAALFLTGSLVVLRPDLRLVERVEFSGTRHASVAALRHLSDFRNGTRVWEADLRQVEQGVLKHPWIRTAQARLVWPDTIKVEVTEHTPVALLHYEKIHYVAADGTVFLAALGTDLDYPSITGIKPEFRSLHPRLSQLVLNEALLLLRELDSRGLARTRDLDEVHFDSARGFTVYVGHSRVLFRAGNIGEQLDRLDRLISTGKVNLDRPVHVDLGPRNVAIVRDLTPRSEG